MDCADYITTISLTLDFYLHFYLEIRLSIGILSVVVSRDTCIVYQQVEPIFRVTNCFHKSLDIFFLADVSRQAECPVSNEMIR